MTLREQLQADLQAAEAKASEIRARIAALEAVAASYLDKTVDELRSVFQTVKEHLGL